MQIVYYANRIYSRGNGFDDSFLNKEIVNMLDRVEIAVNKHDFIVEVESTNAFDIGATLVVYDNATNEVVGVLDHGLPIKTNQGIDTWLRKRIKEMED